MGLDYVAFKTLRKELAKVESKYDKDREKLRAKLEIASNKFFKDRDSLLKQLVKVCPHEKEEYHDDWHPHTRDGDQYYKCTFCGHERKA